MKVLASLMLFSFIITILIDLISFLIAKNMEYKEIKRTEKVAEECAERWKKAYLEELNKNNTSHIKEMLENSTRLQMLTQENNLLKSEKALLEIELQKVRHDNKNVPDGTIDAVKYAVKKSHPDNGGNADDFIRFKKCLDELSEQS